MRTENFFRPSLALAAVSLAAAAFAAQPPLPGLSVSRTNTTRNVVKWNPYPAADTYTILHTTNLAVPFTVFTNGVAAGPAFDTVATNKTGFYRLEVTPMPSNALFSANLLNRIAYGPTPDDLERVAGIGPQAYIDEQIAAETISEPVPTLITEVVNSAPGGYTGQPEWRQQIARGTLTSGNLYIYLTATGSALLDDIELIPYTITTNGAILTTNYGVNLLTNGGFETTYRGPWTNGAIYATSTNQTTNVHSGTSALRISGTAAGTAGAATSINQGYVTGTNANGYVELRYWYYATTNSDLITVRVGSSSSGVVSGTPNLPALAEWVYFQFTGNAGSTPTFYLYPDGSGTYYLDDVVLVHGTNAGVGVNVLTNGDFETGALAPWQATADFTNSTVTGEFAHSGNYSLKLVATGSGSGNGDSIFQTSIAGITNNQPYTLSFWYRPDPTYRRSLLMRLSGASVLTGIYAEPDKSPGGLLRRLEARGASKEVLRQWFCQNAVGSKRQLIEVMSQWLENHFVTQHAKSQDYLDTYYDDFTYIDILAADWEYREMSKWRAALLNPQCSFYDLLRISAESPAMVAYLDTAGSRGDGSNIANENYARELFELFAMGVDNGYDQTDIVECSRTWTGWSIELVDAENINNPFAAASTTFVPGYSSTSKSNIVGVWSLNYRGQYHSSKTKYIFYNWDATGTNRLGPKTVPARFGSPWAGRPYSLVCTNNTTGAGTTSGMQDGYQVIAHVADLPFTQEYIVVKLCRLFIHDNFVHNVYDYTQPNLSPEAALVRAAMLAWETPPGGGPKGQMRHVLDVILNSDLFRSHSASMQKIKTPLEFVISATRALRSVNANGSATAYTDGVFSTPLTRMGSMRLFDRAEPDGYPEYGAAWISAGTLTERLRFIQSLCADSGQSGGRPSDAGNTYADPVALLKKKLPSTDWGKADVVTDYFLSILYPGEGRANLSQYRTMAITFLNTADNGTTSLFSSQSNTGSTYRDRVRGMVSLLMTTQRFHEQ